MLHAGNRHKGSRRGSTRSRLQHVHDSGIHDIDRFAIGIGHESPAPRATGAPAVLGGCNFGVLLPWWDMLFGTADFTLAYPATGVRDQVEQGRDYGQGFWSQQWRGVLRLLGRA